MSISESCIGVIGLGYVGLPLALAFSERFSVIGFDICQHRIDGLMNGIDSTGALGERQSLPESLQVTADESSLEAATIFVVTVPTPIDEKANPDLGAIKSAAATVGRHIRRGGLVVFESTVYPGVTEDIAVPIIEQCSGLLVDKDFDCGYSPERINPGDRQHTLTTINKVISARRPDALTAIQQLYGAVWKATLFPAASIRVAEAAKVLENTQRDVNIALMNESAKLFSQLGINTHDVLAAAQTKWNFIPFEPGLVGGHCIGVDPYYLIHCAQQEGVETPMMQTARDVNQSMGGFIAEQVISELENAQVADPRVAILGMSYKENVADARNSQSTLLHAALNNANLTCYVVDPVLDQYGLSDGLTDWAALPEVDACVLACPHQYFLDLPLETWAKKLRGPKLLFDVRCRLPESSLTPLGIQLRIW